MTDMDCSSDNDVMVIDSANGSYQDISLKKGWNSLQ